MQLYHLQLSGLSRENKWKPMVFILLVAFFALSLSFFTSTLGEFLLTILFPDFNSKDLLNVDVTNTAVLIVNLLSVSFMGFSVFISMYLLNIKPTALIHSIENKFRWLWFLKSCLFVALPSCVILTINFLIVIASSSSKNLFSTKFSTFLIVCVIILCLVPLQAASEEYMFRAAPAIAFGAYFKSPFIVYAIPVPFFMMVHPDLDLWSALNIIIVAGCASFMLWRTGGVESAIVYHATNNIVVFGFLATGLLGGTSRSTLKSDFQGVVATLLVAVVSMLLVHFTYKEKQQA